MRITEFEQTGLDQVVSWIKRNNIKVIGREAFKEAMKSVNISLVFEEIDRFQSTFICEQKDSYVQQSQRYVIVDTNGYNMPKLDQPDYDKVESLIKKAFNLYNRMTEKKEGSANKGRPKNEDYKYGIPIEDGRYILPLAAKTNVSAAMTGDKLVDMVYNMCDDRYFNAMSDILLELEKFIPAEIWEIIYDQHLSFDHNLIQDLYTTEYFDKITNENRMVLLSHFTDLNKNVARGALTSTKAETPSEVIKSWGDDYHDKAIGVIERVTGYGHTGICEQARTMFGMMMSLTAYHQQIRHRLPVMHREEIFDILEDIARPVVVPTTIRYSPFFNEYLQLVQEFKSLRYILLDTYDMDTLYSLLLNCDQIKFTISTNARIDEKMLSERTCMTAQWEIRELSTSKLMQLRHLSGVLYEKALPPCLFGTCKEGAMTCGKKKELLEIWGNIKEEKQNG